MRLTIFTAYRARITWLVVALGIFVTSCSESKVSQCNRLIEIANRAVEGVQTASATPQPDSIESMNRIADVANNARSEMEALQLNDERLQGYQTRFVTMYTETNQATRDLVTAAQAKDADGAQRAFQALQTATAQEEPLVNEVNAYCEPQSSTSPVPTPVSPPASPSP